MPCHVSAKMGVSKLRAPQLSMDHEYANFKEFAGPSGCVYCNAVHTKHLSYDLIPNVQHLLSSDWSGKAGSIFPPDYQTKMDEGSLNANYPSPPTFCSPP